MFRIDTHKQTQAGTLQGANLGVPHVQLIDSVTVRSRTWFGISLAFYYLASATSDVEVRGYQSGDLV